MKHFYNRKDITDDGLWTFLYSLDLGNNFSVLIPIIVLYNGGNNVFIGKGPFPAK